MRGEAIMRIQIIASDTSIDASCDVSLFVTDVERARHVDVVFYLSFEEHAYSRLPILMVERGAMKNVFD